MEAQNALAGQGAVVLDIGGDIGALIVEMPSALDGIEIEIRPVGSPDSDHDHDHEHDHLHEHGHGHYPHVAVVTRPTSGGLVPSLVFAELESGVYELYERVGRSAGIVVLTVSVHGGEVTHSTWPEAEEALLESAR